MGGYLSALALLANRHRCLAKKNSLKAAIIVAGTMLDIAYIRITLSRQIDLINHSVEAGLFKTLASHSSIN